jgi:hypothetical protein
MGTTAPRRRWLVDRIKGMGITSRVAATGQPHKG